MEPNLDGYSIAHYSNEWSSVISSVMKTIVERLNPMSVEDSSVINFRQPAEMIEKFDLSLSFRSDLDLKGFTELCEQIVDNSVKTGHPHFRNQLYGGTDAYGLAAALLIEALNTNTHTYDVAPLLSLIEMEVVRSLCELCGFPNGGEGISCPGGSIANMYGINLARFFYNRNVKKTGLFGAKRLLVFASHQAHYSVIKGVSFMGLGTDSLIFVDCDSNGAMDQNDLSEKIKMSETLEDAVPLMVWCTSGTTVLGAFDPLLQIRQLCDEHNLWMHVDACLGGGLLVSSQCRKRYFQGIERVDSLSWNWHKLAGAPLQTSIFLTSHKGLLAEAHKCSASYLFHTKKHYDTRYDWGDMSVQCGRKPDALKIWLMWKSRGLKGLEQRINETCELADYMAKRIGSHPRFRLVLPESQGTTVCFWVVPPRVARSYEKNSDEYWKEVEGVAMKLKSRMVMKGLAHITYQPLPDRGLVNFFRCTLTCHPPFTRTHVENIIDIMSNLSDDL